MKAPRVPALDAPFAVLDLEALDWNRYRVGWFVDSLGNGTECKTPEALSRCVEAFEGRVFAHYGGRYDLFFLSRPSALTLSGSGILRAQVGRASVYDSWFLFQQALAKIGKAVGKLKHAGKSDRIEELSDAETSEHCRNDCEVLVTALDKHREWCRNFGHTRPRWPATAGGTAVYCLEACEPDGVAHLGAQAPELGDWLRQYAAVSGGRVEMWRAGKVAGPVYAYDINSSYPRSWLDGPFALGPWKVVTGGKGEAPGVYRCAVRQSRSSFPIVAPGHAWRYDGEAYLTHEEVAEVRLHGGAVEVLDGWASQTAPVDFGRTFAERLYTAKLAGDPWSKVAINSAHGKFSQGVVQTAYVHTAEGWRHDYELAFPSWHQRPLVGAYVLARARIRLHRTMHALKVAGWSCYYTDTDCVHTDCPPERFPGVLGLGLGEWKLEATAAEAIYVAPKVYALKLGDGSVKMAAKGLPRKAVTWEVMERAAAGHVQVLTEDAGLRSFRALGAEWAPMRKTSRRALTTHTGGKTHGTEAGRLDYADA